MRAAQLVLISALILSAEISAAATITVMSFNAQNLFDVSDDPANPGDDSYLPLAVKDGNRARHDLNCDKYYGGHAAFVEQCKKLDWNDGVYATKLQRLADVIKSLAPIPDVVVFQEVENRRVLEDLVNRHLSMAGYQVIQLDTTNKINNRGLDVGILTRLELAGDPEARRVSFGNKARLCGTIPDILRVPLRLPDGETLHVFGVHFSPRGNQFVCRIRAFEMLNDLVAALPPQSLAVAAGDFNINCIESRTVAMTRLLESGDWHVSPLVRNGCDAPGSHRRLADSAGRAAAWSFLDMILVSGAFSPTMPSASNWFADPGSFTTVVAHPEQIQAYDGQGNGAPQWFDPVSGSGVSDHFPVAIRLMTRRN